LKEGKTVQVADKEWISWNVEKGMDMTVLGPTRYVGQFHRVWKCQFSDPKEKYAPNVTAFTTMNLVIHVHASMLYLK